METNFVLIEHNDSPDFSFSKVICSSFDKEKLQNITKEKTENLSSMKIMKSAIEKMSDKTKDNFHDLNITYSIEEVPLI